VSEWITGNPVTLVRVDHRGTSQSFHHGCPASPPGNLQRDRTNWDYDQNLADINPPWWEKLFFMSHPSIQERIEYNR